MKQTEQFDYLKGANLEWANTSLNRTMDVLAVVEDEVFMAYYTGNYTAEECAVLSKIQDALNDCMSKIYDVQSELFPDSY